jgi:hypothetical protein
MITLKRFRRLEAVLVAHGYQTVIDWSENIPPAGTADAFAEEAIYVICNSGMRVTVGAMIAEKCLAAVKVGKSACSLFGHNGKCRAIDEIWARRDELFAVFQASKDPVTALQELPWIGPVTRYHLAKNLGVDVAKPDVHLERLARRDRTTTKTLCRRLARQSGYRVATVDTILWRACADGVLKSRIYELKGWKAAFKGKLSATPAD